MASAQSSESSSRQAAGSCRRARYSKGGAAERGEARVHPRGVGGEQVPLVRRQGLDGASRDEPEPQDARLAVHLERGPAEERRELAGGAPPEEVHLEEALLRVQEAGGARHVEAAPPAHDRHAERVALDAHRRAETGDRPLALELREARPEPGLEVGAAAARGEGDGGHGAADDQRPAPALVIPRDVGRAGSRGIRHHFAFDWLATASAAFFAASGSPR